MAVLNNQMVNDEVSWSFIHFQTKSAVGQVVEQLQACWKHRRRLVWRLLMGIDGHLKIGNIRISLWWINSSTLKISIFPWKRIFQALEGRSVILLEGKKYLVPVGYLGISSMWINPWKMMVVQGYSWYMVDKSPLDFKGTRFSDQSGV